MDLKQTVFLPKTDFPMKANLAQREPDFIQYWQDIGLYKKLREQSKDRQKFILHFGPPYANGHIHMGHALSEVLKDIINKTQQMRGYDAPMVPGWDCHGLPIEWKIEEHYRTQGIKKDDVPILEFLAECRAFAEKWKQIQKDEFIRLGIIADFENPYSTMDFESEACIIEQLFKFVDNGMLYRGLKPVMWSVIEKTALAEAEIEYHEHTSDSVFVKFDVVQSSVHILKGVSFVIWTTTPWTLPGNRAIAYGDEIEYDVVEFSSCEEFSERTIRVVVARSLLAEFLSKLKITDYTVIGTIMGNKLKGTICAHPWRGKGYDFDVPLLPGEHVTTESGTGLVHTAPGHGLEDFALGQEYGIEIPATVQDDGTYYNHVPLFAGEHIYRVYPKILDELRAAGALLHTSKLVHSYPHSWRSKTPLIYRATAQWFISMETLRQKALDAIDTVQWFPKQGKNRILSMVQTRPDWCISRQRSWGVPLTLFVNKQNGEILKDPMINQRITQIIRERGVEAWHTLDVQAFFGDQYRADDFEKVNDILDVWFDSGCTHEFVLKNRDDQSWPADVYFEGSDQHRGWFQSSLLQSCGTTGQAPYKNVVTHGFVVDEKGYKMSKSLGNTLSPQQIISTMGADMLRLWIVASDYTQDLRIGADILKHQEDIYRRFRNTLRYLLGALEGFDSSEYLDESEMPELELWVLYQLTILEKLHQQSVEDFDYSTFYSALHNFCAVDLSAFYFDIRKDTLYCDGEDSLKRRANRTVMAHVFQYLVRWFAPALSFTAEEAWQSLTKGLKCSVHELLFEHTPTSWRCEGIDQKWQKIRELRRVMTCALEIERAAKTIRSSLQAHIAVYVSNDIASLLQNIDIAELAITSSAQLLIAQPPASAVTLEDVDGIGVIVEHASGKKCDRCWKVLPEVREIVEDNTKMICQRCDDVLIKTTVEIS